MHGTAKIIYRPTGWTDEILLYPIRDFASLSNTSRRQLDRMVSSGELERVMVHGLSCIPGYELRKFNTYEDGISDESGRQRSTGGDAAGPTSKAEHGTTEEVTS